MTHVLIIGGSSGMGLALARALLAEHTDVTIAGRSADRLARAAAQLTAGHQNVGHPKTGHPNTKSPNAGHQKDIPRARLTTAPADITSESDVAALFDRTGPLDHVAVTAADATGAYGRSTDIDPARARAIVEAKLLGAWLVGRYAAGRVTGSLTYTSGINAYRPNGSNTIVAAANGALASLAYGLALELAPVRVNVVSPGWVDSPIWDQLGMTAADRTAAFAQLAERLPARRIGTPDDIAQAFVALMRNGFTTGTVLHVDGGHRLLT